MKLFRKISFLTAALLMLFSLCACSAETPGGEEKDLIEHGMDVIAMMDELAESEIYRNLMTRDDAVVAYAQAAAQGEYAEYSAVYAIKTSSLQSQFEDSGDDSFTDALSESTMEYLEGKNLASLAAQLNSTAGLSALAAASVYTANKTFVSDALTEGAVYLYVFGNGIPAAITFLPGEDHTVSASGCFLMAENFPTDSADAILSMLDEIPGASVEKIA